jgi:polyhydroxybutyrate depolymerase
MFTKRLNPASPYLYIKTTIVFFSLFVWSCLLPIEPAYSSYSFTYNGTQREYSIHIPSDLPQNAPLIFVLHGYHGSAIEYTDWFKMDALADTHGFVVVFPQGINDASGNTHWNSGFPGDSVDDVGFLSALATSLQSHYNLDPSKTFTSGISNGGFMSYYLISQRPDIFKAAASISGTMSNSNWQNRSSIVPAPVLQIHGVLDNVVPIDGSMDTAGGWGGAPEMSAIIEFWKNLDECTSSNTIQVNEHTIAYKYANGLNGNEVWYYIIDNYGHETPLGENGSINSPALLWEFFSNIRGR